MQEQGVGLELQAGAGLFPQRLAATVGTQGEADARQDEEQAAGPDAPYSFRGRGGQASRMRLPSARITGVVCRSRKAISLSAPARPMAQTLALRMSVRQWESIAGCRRFFIRAGGSAISVRRAPRDSMRWRDMRQLLMGR